METLRQWQNQTVAVDDDILPSTLEEVIGRHRAEIWSHSLGTNGQSYLRILLPAMEGVEVENIHKLTIISKSRPEFYDFDLFDQPDQESDLDMRRLTELTYTVFRHRDHRFGPQRRG